jgi:glycosyltransferase involved in cell wall biosynthesis
LQRGAIVNISSIYGNAGTAGSGVYSATKAAVGVLSDSLRVEAQDLRRKIREQLHLGPDAFVIGMVAPFQPEYDHATFIKAVGELIKSNPNVAVVLAGLSAIANFFFIPYYPFWSLLMIAMAIWVIWALTRPGVGRVT